MRSVAWMAFGPQRSLLQVNILVAPALAKGLCMCAPPARLAPQHCALKGRFLQMQAAGCSAVAGVTPSLAVFLLLLVGALLGAAAGAAAVWWHNRRQLRYLQPQSPRQAYAASLQVLPRAARHKRQQNNTALTRPLTLCATGSTSTFVTAEVPVANAPTRHCGLVCLGATPQWWLHACMTLGTGGCSR